MGAGRTVLRANPSGEIEPVYNLHVASGHTYFVGDPRCAVLVHNESPDPVTGTRQLLTLANIQKLHDESQKRVDAIRQANPNDPRLLFLDTQQDILAGLAKGGGPFTTPEQIDWLARVLTRFMGSLNNAT